ncbi:UNVERIFIED_ORG: hypothetical protein M2402_001007 [Rahnella aquatilis]
MYIGLPQWHHSAWAKMGLRDLLPENSASLN